MPETSHKETSHEAAAQLERLAYLVRDIPNYPKPGIIFKDITPLLRDAGALALSVELLIQPFRNQRVDLVAGAESRGFIFGTAVATALSVGFVPIRKPGKLPSATRSQEYTLEYGTDRLEIHQDAISPGQNVLLVDDLLATGGTMAACCQLVKACGGHVAGVAVLIELEFLRGRGALDGHLVHTILRVTEE